MRLAQQHGDDNSLSKWIGEMSYNPDLQGTISLPSYIKQLTSEKDFIKHVYPDNALKNPITNGSFFKERAILCSKNDVLCPSTN